MAIPRGIWRIFLFYLFFGEQLGLGADSRKEEKIKSMDLSPALEERERGREHKLSFFTRVKGEIKHGFICGYRMFSKF